MGDQRNRLSPAQTLQRRQRLVELRGRKTPWATIAAELNYSDGAAAATDYRRVLEQRRTELNLTTDETIQEELEHLEELTRQAIDLLDRDYIRWIGSGENGSEEFDPAPKLQAIAELRRLSESRRKLLGLDAPTRVEADGELKVIVEGVDLDGLT